MNTKFRFPDSYNEKIDDVKIVALYSILNMMDKMLDEHNETEKIKHVIKEKLCIFTEKLFDLDDINDIYDHVCETCPGLYDDFRNCIIVNFITRSQLEDKEKE